MNDFDLDDLKSALNNATPAPDPKAKADNIALATKNFANSQAALQGSRQHPRPTSSSNIWTGTMNMLNHLTSRAGLTVTTAIVACGFMVVTPQGRDLLNLDPTTAKIATPEVATTEAFSPDVVAAETTAPAARTEDAPVVILREAVPQADATVSVEGITTPLLSQTDQAPEYNDRIIIEPFAVPAPRQPQAQGQIAPNDNAADAELMPMPNTETFANDAPNPLKITSDEPVSTFSIDVDTAAYSLIRSSITAGQLPPPDAVRIEEMINYFPYAYPAPDGDAPFQPTVNVFETPWNADTQLVHIGIQGEMPSTDDRPPLNLVFLIDTSGSMESAEKLPLLRQSFRLMLDNLRPEDEVAIVTYADSTSVALDPTAASNRADILAALNALSAGGSTNGQGGIEAAYALAETMKDDGDVSRVILATDGDFNVGLSDPRGLESYIEDKRDSGTYLSVLGFGRGNLQDATMQSLAQNGNGTAAYIDTLSEAQKVLVDNLTGALFPIANDVKIQVEFNPATIAEYRLIGYETRALAREDFNNDAVDAGELGAGHTVTAIFEVTPVGSPAQLSDPLRYQAAETTATSDELGFLRLRYKAPGSDTSQLIETPFTTGTPNTEALFAASIAAFGQLLRDDTYLNGYSFDDAIALANANRGDDPFGYRTQAVQLMRLAGSLSN
ncbi:von Willebrand factor type A domain-containing protein [Octadecabacter sp. G9-8]|uniref:von Willebrand factor type A domain-containing protein n=1 Tax=Octadecabacter dasysiphoniae TaxID=2909341 RepID=A0ABS9CY59_9RHOB|nr:von Willebrand factor type A domain-containing protein [Octadecabacter dasysiphoniae]MCF2871008.1 von Willebrand factor type A domain-containing protein [Octadecabacter dasysiphoniae]